LATTDSILAHCIARAVTADAGGEEAAKAKYGEQAEVLKGSKWQSFKVAAKVTPRAARVAGFITLWGLALDDLDRDELSVDEYAEWANESRATAFRRASEYRELWGDVDVNELGRFVRNYVRSHRGLRKKPNALMSIPVLA
jgi:hypothetical protein